jgi:hypothetical protein
MHNKFILGVVCTALALLILLNTSSTANASIMWNTPTAITTSDAMLKQPGYRLIGAEEWGASSSNVNVSLSDGSTVTFLAGTLNGSDSFASTSGGLALFGANGYHNSNASLQSALVGFQYQGTTSPLMSVTFNNLTPGVSYLAQLLALDNRGISVSEHFSTDSTGATNNSANFLVNADDYVTGQFTATGTTQSFYFFSSNSAYSTDLTAAALYQVPEPTSLGLLGFAGLLTLRRRPRAC